MPNDWNEMKFAVAVILLGVNIAVISGCGVSTHTEIGHRATEYFKDQTGGVDYKKLILANQDAFQAGNPYPDAFYSNYCKGGQFHNVSEDSHWVPFLSATINYIRRVYPRPWDKEAEKLVVFMLGFVSHQVADVLWHSLGIDQGFLSTMGDMNFHGSFDHAHSVGDIGGDIVAAFEFNLSYIDSLSDWYIPTKDLVEIYKDLYGHEVVNSSLIEDCTTLLFLARLGEKLAIAKLFPDYASKSPFMLEQFQSYFLGGLDDMATWTANVWHKAIHMLNNGTNACSLPRNPIYVSCNKTSKSAQPPSFNEDAKNLSGLYTSHSLHGLTPDLVQKQQTARGVHFSMSKTLKGKIKMLLQGRKMSKVFKMHPESSKLSTSSYLKSTLTTSNSYAHLGWSLLTADINADDIDDLIVGAPGYSELGNPQSGKIFAVFGNEGTRLQQLDLDSSANFTLSGTYWKNGHFGTAVAVLDFNHDGMEDLAISAPSSGSPKLNYTGSVHIYLARSPGVFNATPSFTITCESKYCNLGWSLATADLNQDGYLDLIIGSPFVANGQKQSQSGALWVVFSSKDKQARKEVSSVEKEGKLLVEGDQEYGWLGYSLLTKPKKQGQGSWLLVSQPTYRICAKSNCEFSSNDIQSVGRLLVYDTLNMTEPVQAITGKNSFMKLGSSFGIGDPYDTGKELLGVGADTIDVNGKIVDVAVTFTQAGNVNLYNLTSTSHGTTCQNHHRRAFRSTRLRSNKEPPPIAVLEGDRSLGRFGQSLLLEDVTGDNIDDVIIGAPLRIDDITEELYGGEQGAVYIFKGGKSFPRGNVTRQCDLLHKLIEPCPGDKALSVLSGPESGSRFGHQIITWTTAKTRSLVVAAPRSSQEGRLSGSVFVYSGFN